MAQLVKLAWPSSAIFDFTEDSFTTYPSPFSQPWLLDIYYWLMPFATPATIGAVYFALVHFANHVVKQRQIAASRNANNTSTPSNRLKPAPYAIARTRFFKVFVLLHNVFLCVYSVWTFVGFTLLLRRTMAAFDGQYVPQVLNLGRSAAVRKVDLFFQTVCDPNRGIFSRAAEQTAWRNLEVFGWWFYILKFYEVVDTMIILLKGKPSLLLQSYHHTGAMLCMWAGMRFHSLPIWIFVVFNLFIHAWMYFYYTLCCLKIRVPSICKRVLTSLQIFQFVIGGSLALAHLFMQYMDTSSTQAGDWLNCVRLPADAMSLMVNVVYLAPLTALFGSFYIDSYLKKKS